MGRPFPQLMTVNPQVLKNSTKIARVLVVDENPISMREQSTRDETLAARPDLLDNNSLDSPSPVP